MNYTDSDIKAIVDTKTEQLQKEIRLKDEEYEILRTTSDQVEEEQRQVIYELKQKLKKLSEYLDNIEDDSLPANCEAVNDMRAIVKG